MTKTFMLRLSEIRPSQLYVSSKKLAQVMKALEAKRVESIEPIPVKKLGEDIIFVDGHTRALAAYLLGAKEVSVYWETDELDWDEYEACVEWCKKEGVHTIADLKARVVPPEEYETLWIKRCEKMQQGLEAERRKKHARSEHAKDVPKYSPF